MRRGEKKEKSGCPPYLNDTGFRPYSYPEEMDFPLKKYYAPGFVDPLFAQYKREPCKELKVEAGPLFRPELVRRHRGWTFQRLHPSDPCPVGWSPFERLSKETQEKVRQYTESDPHGYCFLQEPEFEPVMYSDKHKWYGNVPILPDYPSGPAAPPPKSYKSFGYMTGRPNTYVKDSEPYGMLYNPRG